MARTPRLTRIFCRASSRLDPKVRREVAAVISALCKADPLPAAADIEALIPPTAQAFVRRVPGRNVWVWYVANDDTLTVLHATTNPPVPVFSD